MKNKAWIALTAAILATTAVGAASMYVVPVYEFAIVTQFGRVVEEVKEPGLKFKIPFIQEVTMIDSRLRNWDGEPSDLLTIDKENIEVNTWARWKVTEPRRFYEAVRTESAGQSVLDGVVEASVKNVISANRLYEALRNTQRRLQYESEELEEAEAARNVKIAVGREKVANEILTRAGTGAVDEYGFTINGLQIKTFNYVKSVIPKIYERMRSERIRIANRYESEGREREAKILGKMAKDLEKIESEGYASAATIRGSADAEVLKIYADAYGKDSEFYSFSRSLDLFPKTFSSKMRLVLSADDHDFLRYLKGFGRFDGQSHRRPSLATPAQ
ncbi:MAG: protease modulator HflC [Myxococcota bacterium]|nr:protease modulator HflC [Myxococcota bacterium]